MNESIKDRFLKEHELSLEDLDKVNGGSIDFGAVSIICPNCHSPFQVIAVDNLYVTDICCPDCSWYHDDVTKEEAKNRWGV